MKKVKSGGVSMILKTGIELAQEYTFFNYGPPRPHKDINYQDITIVAWPGFNLAPIFFLPGNSKEKVGKETPPDALIVNNLENCWPLQWIKLVSTQVDPLWRF